MIRTYIAARFALLLLIAAAVAGCGTGMPNDGDMRWEQNDRYAYRVAEDETSGVRLHMLRAEPEQLDLVAINANVTDAGRTGINGGFFYNGQLLSIAIEDDIPAAGEPGGYGSGWFNVKYARGTLVYDKILDRLSVQVVSSADELDVSDRGHYWAQGGISMSLAAGDGTGWRVQADAEAAPYPDDERLRSALVYDENGDVLLIVTSTACTLEELRDAIGRMSEAYGIVDGIFLDGDGSSQLAAAEELLPGDGRMVVQMIEVTAP